MSTAGRVQADVSLNFWEEPRKARPRAPPSDCCNSNLEPGPPRACFAFKTRKGLYLYSCFPSRASRGLPWSASLPLAAGSCPRHPTSQAGHPPATSLPLLSALTSAVPPSRSQWLCLPPLVQASRNAGLPVLLQVFRTRRSRSVSRAT